MPARKKTTNAGDAPATGRAKKTATPTGNGDAPATRKPRATPAAVGKAKTINKYLGSNFRVLASYGHVRDLPRRRKKGEQVAGINIEAGWVPTYVVLDREEGKTKGRRTAKDILAELKKEADRSSRGYLATDPGD